ncbi:hypothetical protein SESBI_37001, partial [Sesbania bispinosa]
INRAVHSCFINQPQIVTLSGYILTTDKAACCTSYIVGDKYNSGVSATQPPSGCPLVIFRKRV